MGNYDYCSILMIAVRVPPVRGNDNCASSNEDTWSHDSKMASPDKPLQKEEVKQPIHLIHAL